MNWRKWFGFAENTLPEAKAPGPDLVEYGATGTPVFSGYLRDLGEYNPTLDGLSAFSTYEQMRRSDGQVAATLAAMKLPIRSAEWIIAGPQNPAPIEQEATDFIRQQLFEEEIDWGDALENALLMLDFGCSAHEDCYVIDGNRVKLKKLAPRLPITFTRWLLKDGEDFAGIEQQGYAGERYLTATVPAEKLALFTHQREGNNWAGRSVMRPMYQHWYIKKKLYLIEAIAVERNGLGIPKITMGADAKREDISTAREWLDSIATHEKAGILLPSGWEFGLEGVTGKVRDPKDAIAHHNMMISMAGLAMFMQLGQSESGNRALGQTQSDFFALALDATARHIARAMNWSTIPRLVDFNFGGLKRYPELVAQNILSIKFESLVAALKDLAVANMVQADDDLEKWLRQKLGAPQKGNNPRARIVPRTVPATLAGSGSRGRIRRCRTW